MRNKLSIETKETTMKFYRPLPIKKEIKIPFRDFIVSKTDEKGNIIYTNDTFSKITGYSKDEVMGAPHNILRHPDMPSVIFFLMWQRIQSGKNIKALVKNLTKSGKFYWVSTDFEMQKNEQSQNNTYIAFRRSVPHRAIETIEPLYKKLLRIERLHGQQASLVYLQEYLDERQTTFDEYMDSILKPKNFIAIIFNSMKNTFAKAA